ncbi:MAG: triose-phosphate isomerase [Balneolaceae bacterium]
MRSFLIAGNWKMNAGPKEAEKLIRGMKSKLGSRKPALDILICPPYISIPAVVKQAGQSAIQIGAQNVHFEDNGAYTGEVSTSMLKEAGCDYVIVGHSERREYFGDTDEIIAKKVKKAIDDNINVIFCVGEKLEQRKSGNHQQIVMDQLQAVISHLTEENAGQLTFAYEPVWAIGTGETATPDQAQEMHQFIRNFLTEHWSTQRLADVRILYGGSMKPKNAEELLQQPDVDGGLIGGASLDADSFCAIIDIAEKISSEQKN